MALAAFDKWLHTTGTPLAAGLAMSGIMAYAACLKARRLSAHTRFTYIAGLSAFYRYAVRSGLVTVTVQELETTRDEIGTLQRDLSRAIARAPLHARLPKSDDVERVLAVARQLPNEVPDDERKLIALRNRAMIFALATTGARVSELAGMKRDALLPDDKAATVKGKGGKSRVVYFSDEAWGFLNEYLTYRFDEYYSKNAVLQPVFGKTVGENGRPAPLSPRFFQIVVRRVAKQAGVESVLTPHSFRHYVATRFLQKTGDIAMTQDLLGHASPTTTRIYAATDQSAMRKKHREIFNA